ncbi:LxmA leader domain family RiPP [Nocardioides nanhaiensis]|uniref:Thiocillin family RiPP n=1 Tax=Nocardioides nanhaiensis TaxID=1476871 RepID=A0ABP8VS79_9ACTN
MSTQDLIAGYAAYTDAERLAHVAAEAPAITPTTTSSTFCAATASAISAASAENTIEHTC